MAAGYSSGCRRRSRGCCPVSSRGGRSLGRGPTGRPLRAWREPWRQPQVRGAVTSAGISGIHPAREAAGIASAWRRQPQGHGVSPRAVGYSRPLPLRPPAFPEFTQPAKRPALHQPGGVSPRAMASAPGPWRQPQGPAPPLRPPAFPEFTQPAKWAALHQPGGVSPRAVASAPGLVDGPPGAFAGLPAPGGPAIVCPAPKDTGTGKRSVQSGAESIVPAELGPRGSPGCCSGSPASFLFRFADRQLRGLVVPAPAANAPGAWPIDRLTGNRL